MTGRGIFSGQDNLILQPKLEGTEHSCQEAREVTDFLKTARDRGRELPIVLCLSLFILFTVIFSSVDASNNIATTLASNTSSNYDH